VPLISAECAHLENVPQYHFQRKMPHLLTLSYFVQTSKELHSTAGPVRSLPLLCIADEEHPLRDIPVCSPIQRDFNFFASEQMTSTHPPRADFMDGCTLRGFALSTGDYVTHKKLSATVSLLSGCLWADGVGTFRGLKAGPYLVFFADLRLPCQVEFLVLIFMTCSPSLS
jgi:hypothetical protein